MDRILSNAQMRAADNYTIEKLCVPSKELMRRAGQAIAEEVVAVAQTLGLKDILVVCGTGNNGGDGYVCAGELLRLGYDVKIYAFDGRLSTDCERAKNAYSGGYTKHICGAIIVDCLFGTGLTRSVEGQYAETIKEINASGAIVISADIPSGLNGDNGAICGCAVKANYTVAVAEYKFGHFLGEGLDYCGKLVKRYIGITVPQEDCAFIYDSEDIKKYYPIRKRNSHKGTYGSANIVAGSDKYIGAAALCTEAALKSGCGFVKLTTSEKVKLALAAKFPQTVFLNQADLYSQAVALGPGCCVSEELFRQIARILEVYDGSVILDADALNSLAKYGVHILKEKKCDVLITPHVKEFSRLTGKTVAEILSDPVNFSQSFAKEYGVTVLLKGAATVITDGCRTVVNIRGNSALAKGGSGDMLTGYVCGTAARGISLFDSAVCATYVLGTAAEFAASDKTEYCATSKDILKNLHFAVKSLTT